MSLPEFRKDSKLVLIVPTPKQFVMFSIPAILYTVNNNLVVHIQAYVDPASFQVRYYLETFNFKPSFRMFATRVKISESLVGFFEFNIFLYIFLRC